MRFIKLDIGVQYVTLIKVYVRIKKKFAHYEKPMDIIEQRFDFPDYTSENQERDAKRFEEHQKKDVYIIKVRGHYGAYMPDGEDYISYGNHEAKDLTEFYKHAHKYFEKLGIKPKFHCIHNQGIEDYILHQVQIQKLLGR